MEAYDRNFNNLKKWIGWYFSETWQFSPNLLITKVFAFVLLFKFLFTQHWQNSTPPSAKNASSINTKKTPVQYWFLSNLQNKLMSANCTQYLHLQYKWSWLDNVKISITSTQALATNLMPVKSLCESMKCTISTAWEVLRPTFSMRTTVAGCQINGLKFKSVWQFSFYSESWHHRLIW